MSAIKDGRFPLELEDKTYHLLFSLNVIDAIQDKFGELDNLSDIIYGSKAIKDLKWLLAQLINEGAGDGEPELSENDIGKMIHTGNLSEVRNAITLCFALGNSGDDESEDDDNDQEDDEGDEKNVDAGE